MPTPPAILNKIKLLLKLSGSPNSFEAESAQRLADGLIEKHGVTPEELESIKDPKPLYTEDEKLFVSIGIIGWKQQLALTIGTYFECQIVQEELVPIEGPRPFHYYVYGDVDNVKNVQSSFFDFCTKIDQLVQTRCAGKGEVYLTSYCEGVVCAIKENIFLFGLELPQVNKTMEPANDQVLTTKSEELTKPKDKPPAAEKRVDVNAQSNIQDIQAYFNGMYDGRDLFLKDMLDDKI
jgi:hypothetical protein